MRAQEAALAGEHERVNDAQHGVDRIRVGRLVDAAAPRNRIPFGAEIAALERHRGCCRITRMSSSGVVSAGGTRSMSNS
jgi:hypothetical protein